VNPVPNAVVFVPDPQSPLPDPSAVPLECGCSQLYPATVLAHSAPTDMTGQFSIPCAPSGNVTLIVQLGKWRMQFAGVAVTPNTPNTVPNLRLPRNSAEGSLPNIAIATGGADSLECLPLRIGVSASEYVAGSATGGHLHVYTGDGGASTQPASPVANQALWSTQAQMNEHDVILLSCEGHETTDATDSGVVAPLTTGHQQFLVNYANAGGRVFASHFHYAWFNTGPFNTGASKLATWTTGAQQIDDTLGFPADVDTTLAGGGAFPEGQGFAQWLTQAGALDSNNKLEVFFVRGNVHANALLQPPATEWIHLDPSVTQAPSAAQYFSVDMPIGASGGSLCGRIVYSDLHIGGGPGAQFPAPNQNVAVDYPGVGASGIVPTQCAQRALIPQEKALEFMLFDLSSCLVPVGQ
jgi:hypothetical protein